MGKKQLSLTGSEKVCSGNLEVGDIAAGKFMRNYDEDLTIIFVADVFSKFCL